MTVYYFFGGETMEAKLTENFLQAATAYLGYGGDMPSELAVRMEKAASMVMEVAVPRVTFRVCDRNAPVLADICIGKDIDRHLKDCDRVILLCATLGTGIDRTLTRLSVSDFAMTPLFDAAASAAIENVCDNLCAELARLYGPLTNRFSPGYGDLPLTAGRAIAELLDTPRTVGVTLTEAGMMIPQKSVTALVGTLKGVCT